MKLGLTASRPDTEIVEGMAVEPYAFVNLNLNPNLLEKSNESWFNRYVCGRWGFGLSTKQENVTFDGYFSFDLSQKSLQSVQELQDNFYFSILLA